MKRILLFAIVLCVVFATALYSCTGAEPQAHEMQDDFKALNHDTIPTPKPVKPLAH